MTDSKTPRRFTELSDDQRKFIAKLDADDIATLDRVIKLYRTVQGWCRVNRWIVLSLIAALIVVVQFIDGLIRLAGSWKPH
jgi:hypothetical protein